jgi:hypothetical protein
MANGATSMRIQIESPLPMRDFHPARDYPQSGYVAGCLKDVHIREAVRNILEGGGAAFRKCARRLRLRVGPDGRLNSDLDQPLDEWAEILRIL